MTECVTCGAALTGAWCSTCGERRPDNRPYSLSAFGRTAFEAVTNIDGKLPRSLKTLLAKPGLLTGEFMRGRRRPYLHPVQLFLLVNLAFFIIQSPTFFHPFLTRLNIHLNLTPYSGWARQVVGRIVAERGVSLADYASRFDATVATQAKSLVILMVPVFALALAAIQWRRKRFFAEHLVFALHFHAFWLLVMIATYVIIRAIDWGLGAADIAYADSTIDSWSAIAGATILAAYLAIASRRVYGGTIMLNAAKGVLLAVVAFVGLLIYRFVLFLTTIAWI